MKIAIEAPLSLYTNLAAVFSILAWPSSWHLKCINWISKSKNSIQEHPCSTCLGIGPIMLASNNEPKPQVCTQMSTGFVHDMKMLKCVLVGVRLMYHLSYVCTDYSGYKEQLLQMNLNVKRITWDTEGSEESIVQVDKFQMLCLPLFFLFAVDFLCLLYFIAVCLSLSFFRWQVSAHDIWV